MDKYQFIEDRDKKPIIILCGELGACQLLSNRHTKQFAVLKLAPRIQCRKDIEFLSRMDHPNIIKIIQHFDHEQNTLIVFQFMCCGDLYTKIRCNQIKKSKVPGIFRGICSAIQYTHSMNIIHRNLKSQGILLDNHMNPRIVEFGLAARLTTRKTYCGCFYYMAPQLLKNQNYNEKVDIWALGIILYQIIHGDVPFQGQTPNQVLKQIGNWKFYQMKSLPGSVQQLIQLMLCQDFNKRLTIKQVLMHPFLQVQRLNFLKQQNNKTLYSKSNSKIMINHINARKYSIKNSRQQNSSQKIKQSFYQKLTKNIQGKMDAIKDNQKIEKNWRYNFVINP